MLPVLGQVGCIINVSHAARNRECVCSCSRATTEWERWNRNLAHRTEVGYRSSAAAGVLWFGRKCVTFMSLFVWMNLKLWFLKLANEFAGPLGREKVVSLALQQKHSNKKNVKRPKMTQTKYIKILKGRYSSGVFIKRMFGTRAVVLLRTELRSESSLLCTYRQQFNFSFLFS